MAMSEPSGNATTVHMPKRRMLPDRYRDNRLWNITEVVSCIPLIVLAGMILSRPAHAFMNAFSLADTQTTDVTDNLLYAMSVATGTCIVLFLLTPHVVCLIALRPVVLPCPHCGAKPEAEGWLFGWRCPNPRCPASGLTVKRDMREDWNRYAGVVREFLDADRKCACCEKTISINVGLRDGNACYVASCDCATGSGGCIESALDDRADRARRRVSDEDAERRRRSDADARRRCMEGYAGILNADALKEGL